MRGKVATLPLVRSLELVSDLQQLNIVDDVNLISSCEKEGVKDQGNGFTAALLSRFAALFNPVAPPKVPQNLFFKIDFKPNANKYFGSPVYALDVLKLKYLKEYIDSKLKEGVIVPSKSSLVSPVILVPKSSGKLRVCVDYRRLNNITETDNYPLPLLDDIISSISGSKVYSKIDLKDAFHQVPVMDSCCPYMAFKCKFGVFEYTTMPFGLKNTPAVFQRMIDNTLGSLLLVVVNLVWTTFWLFPR